MFVLMSRIEIQISVPYIKFDLTKLRDKKNGNRQKTWEKTVAHITMQIAL